MSLGSIPLLNALPVQQLNIDPRLGGRVEPILQMNNNSIGTTLVPHDTYTVKVLDSANVQSGHIFHEHTNGLTQEKTVYLQYDKTLKHLSVPQAQKFISPAHDVTSNLVVSGSATILGNLTVGGSFTPVITSLASLNVATLRNTNMTSLNANISNLVGVNANINNITATNLTVDNFISNTLISNLSVDNLFAQDGIFTNLTAINPIVGTLASYPSAYSALTITNLIADNLTSLNANVSNLTVANNLNGFGLTLLDDLKLPINSADYLRTSSNGFVQSGSFASVQVGTALTALDALACSGNAATATLATTANNIPKYDRVWYCTHDALLTGAGTVANPISFVGALTGAKAYNTLNPESYQIIQLAPGAYGFAGSVFTLDCSRITIQGLGGYKSVQLIEGLDINVAATFDATNENITLENLAIFNQATAGVSAVNFAPTVRCYLRMNNCFVLADTGNEHAVDVNATGAGSRIYIDNCEILQATGNTAEVMHARRGEVWQLSNSSLTGRGTAPVLRVSFAASVVGAINNTIISSDYAVVNAQDVVLFNVAGNLIMTNATVLASSVNTSATGISLTNAAGNLIISDCQFGIYGAVGKAIQANGGNLISNTGNALGSALLTNNVSVAGFGATVNQTLI
jgi:hypothetical protein